MIFIIYIAYLAEKQQHNIVRFEVFDFLHIHPKNTVRLLLRLAYM